MTFKKVAFLIFLCLFFLFCDVLSKAYCYFYVPPMTSSVYPYGGIGVFRDVLGIDLSINYVENKGAAWGVLSSYQQYLMYARMIIILCLLSYVSICKMPYVRRFSLAFITTGAIGNVIDYFIYGHVVDMFHFRFFGYSYPVFNIADSMIFLGVVILFIFSFFEKKKQTDPTSS